MVLTRSVSSERNRLYLIDGLSEAWSGWILTYVNCLRWEQKLLCLKFTFFLCVLQYCNIHALNIPLNPLHIEFHEVYRVYTSEGSPQYPNLIVVTSQLLKLCFPCCSICCERRSWCSTETALHFWKCMKMHHDYMRWHITPVYYCLFWLINLFQWQRLW